MNPEVRTAALLQRSPGLRDQILQKIASGRMAPLLQQHRLDPDRLAAFVEGRPQRPGALAAAGQGRPTTGQHAYEAIVRSFGRPVLLVRDGTYSTPELDEVRQQLEPHRERIERAIKSVGRVEFLNHAMPWGGTGWLVDEKIVVTNRHVAEIIAEALNDGTFAFRLSLAGVPCGARLDLAEEYNVVPRGPHEIVLKSVKFIARAEQPDIALFEVQADGPLPPPLPLSEGAAADGQSIAIIGYPAYDSRNDPADVARYFGNIFDVKRLAPGLVTQVAGQQSFFMHDATTLGGNSGSVVLDLDSGNALGLHFAGTYLEGNFAVTAEQVKRALTGLKVMVTVSQAEAERPDGDHEAAFFEGREGYRPDFLGDGSLCVPLPGLGPHEADAAEPAEAVATNGKFLNYTHFSLAFSTSRRIPIFTAVNIKGDETKRIKRSGDKWFRDLRLPAEIQLGKDDYDHPDIDRGHMVRREDPNWGPMEVAEIANDDTFHYTNAAPQHSRLNQGKTQWLGLEEYILSSAKTHGLSVSVFTGPVLRDTDRSLENGVQVPEEFWKVVVAVDEDDETLRASGYVLSQGQLIADITEGVVFGQYRTYQVSVATIAEATGLDFRGLVQADVLATRPVPEAVPGIPVVIPLNRLEDMVL